MNKILLMIASFFKAIGLFFKNLFLAAFGSSEEKLKNKYLFKRGGYSIALIALVIVAVIIVNILVTALSNRFTLDVDLSSDGKNSLSEDNAEYIKSVDKDVKITLLSASEADYTGGYMEYYANQSGYSDPTANYYTQTINLLKIYDKYNSKISLKFLDPQGTEFSSLSNTYGNESFYYGDILVECQFTGENGQDFDKHRILHFTDIYSGEDTSGLASMGYGAYEINENKLETELTSAINFVTSEESKKVGFIKSHSNESYFEAFASILKINNYEVENINDEYISEISDEFDALIIAAPTKDFFGDELNAISEFLQNGGKLGKSLIYFADTNNQNLNNLNSFLSEWGIETEPGIVFETNNSYRSPDDPSTFLSFASSGEVDVLSGVSSCYSGYNVPMYASKNTYEGRTAYAVITTSSSVVNMPIGSSEKAEIPENAEKRTFATAIVSVDEDSYQNSVVTSSVIAFSSCHFINAQFMSSTRISNKTLVMNVTEYATGTKRNSIIFENKTIKTEMFTSNNTIYSTLRVIFCVIIPLGLLVLSVVVFIRRKNR